MGVQKCIPSSAAAAELLADCQSHTQSANPEKSVRAQSPSQHSKKDTSVCIHSVAVYVRLANTVWERLQIGALGAMREITLPSLAGVKKQATDCERLQSFHCSTLCSRTRHGSSHTTAQSRTDKEDIGYDSLV